MKYGCNTQGNGPRGRTTTSMMPAGWAHSEWRESESTPGAIDAVMLRIHRPVTTEWIEMRCGIMPQAGMPPDPGCKGCENAPVEWIRQ